MRGKVDDVTLNMQLATWIVNHPFQDNETSIGGEKRRDWVRRMFKDNNIIGKSIDAMASKEAFLRRKYHNAKHWATNAGQQFLGDHGVEAFNNAVLKRCPWFYIFEAGSEKDDYHDDYHTLANNISFGGDMDLRHHPGLQVENMDSSAGIKNELENCLDATSKNVHIFPTNFKVGNSDIIDVDGSSNFMATGESSEHAENATVTDELEFDEINDDDTSNLICDSLESGRYTFKGVLPKANAKQGENRNEELSRTPLPKKQQRGKLKGGNAMAELKFLQLQLEREKFELEKQGKVLERERWEWEKQTKVSERERWEWEKADKVNERRHEKEMAELRIKELELKWKLSVGS